ncbi:hypothetical protein HDU87_008458 [Geranomyces variabilis]|uniref:CUE domain-containing protein n=1 Tax=Geranomyces variabilis TaxID=109894 RepID=A0AAD5TNL3_9FUNG|nr:hypothetical protein HDU87_008458 [Geranomyces variabilis]
MPETHTSPSQPHEALAPLSAPPHAISAAAAVGALKLFPPTLNPSAPQPHSALQAKLTEYTLNQLSNLLRLSYFAFWSTVLYPPIPAYSVAAFLNAFFRQCRTDAALSQKVFCLICRLAIAPLEAQGDLPGGRDDAVEEPATPEAVEQLAAASEWAAHFWADAVYEGGILTLPRLLEITTMFGDLNAGVLRDAFECLLKAQPRLLADFTTSIRLAVQSVHHVQKKYGKASKGKGKGKSKGAAEESPSMSGSGLASPRPGGGGLTVSDDLTLVFQAMRDLRGAVLIGGENFAAVMLSNPDFVPALADTYQVANILSREADDEDGDQTPPVGFQDVDDLAKSAATDIASQARKLKASVLMLVETILNIHFYAPLRLHPKDHEPNESSATPTPKPSISLADVHSRTEVLCDVAIQILELSPFDGPVGFLESAPLLVDLEVAYSVSDWLRKLQALYFSDDGDARLEYIIVSLEQSLTFSGNAETKRMLAYLRTEKAREAAAGPANLSASQSAVAGVASGTGTSPRDLALDNENFIKRTSLISQVQDLFPELGEGFIEACLVALNDNAETVIMKILEDDLPDVVTRLDRGMSRTAPVAPTAPAPPIPPRADSVLTPTEWNSDVDAGSLVSARRNVYDGDEFDIFNRGRVVDLDRVRFGKKNDGGNVLNDKSFVREQRDMLLATQYSSDSEDEDRPTAGKYDMYDDEYDDAYDTSDIKLSGKAEPPTETEEVEDVVLKKKHGAALADVVDPFAAAEAELVAAYTSSPAVFAKSARKQAAREALKKKTQMSDEQIEGWGTMLERNPKKHRVLERYEFRGNKAMPVTASAEQRRQQPLRDNGDESSSGDSDESDDGENGNSSSARRPRSSRGGGQGSPAMGDSRRGAGGGGRGGAGRGGGGGGGGRGAAGGGARGGAPGSGPKRRGASKGHRGRGVGHRSGAALPQD